VTETTIDVSTDHRAAGKYGMLVAALERTGRLRYDELHERYGYGGEGPTTNIIVKTWHHGPMLAMNKEYADGTTELPSAPSHIMKPVIDAGFVGYGFRQGENDDVVLWYLRPIDEIENSVDVSWAFLDSNDEYIRDRNQHVVTVDEREVANQIIEGSEQSTVRYVQ